MAHALVLATLLAAALWGLPGATPAEADTSFSIGINVGTPPPPPPPVVVTAPPQLVVIPGTPVYYAPGLSVNFFFHDKKYYSFHNGSWFFALAYNGPWTFVPVERVPRPVLAVPVQYYKVPPGHMKQGGPPPWAGQGKGPKGKKFD
jgi:hypothetical protein